MNDLPPFTGPEHLFVWESCVQPPSYVYVIQEGETGPVKIGKAVDVPGRIAELQTGNPNPLLLRYILLGGIYLESRLQSEAVDAGAALRGEWFDPDTAAPVLRFIAKFANSMVAAFAAGERGFENYLNYDEDANFITAERRQAEHDEQMRVTFGKADEKRAIARRESARRDERDKRIFRAAQEEPVFSPHRSS